MSIKPNVASDANRPMLMIIPYLCPVSHGKDKEQALKKHTHMNKQHSCITASSFPCSKTVKLTSSFSSQKSSRNLPEPSSRPAPPYPPHSKPGTTYTPSSSENSHICALPSAPRAQNSALPALLEELKNYFKSVFICYLEHVSSGSEYCIKL